MVVNNIVKRIQDIMRKDAGVSGDAQRIEQMTWLFFLKVFDVQEGVWQYNAEEKGIKYVSAIPEELRWMNWAVDLKDGKALTGESLLNFVNEMFKTFKNIPITPSTPAPQKLVHTVFKDLNQYMKDGVRLREVINIINEMDFEDGEDRHFFGDIYESILYGLKNDKHAGEFYTPRALTDFIIEMLDLKLGEEFADYASGTGGFLTSALKYVKKQIDTDKAKQSSECREMYINMVRGQEWKPLPYLLSITNLLLHDIDNPNIINGDSLAVRVDDINDNDRVNVIAMNPPFGGSSGVEAKRNFPKNLQSSETADLFMALILYRLKFNGRAGVILPDGFLFGTEGAKLNIKTKMLKDFYLHTIIRLPGSIFSPYATIPTNILFFNKVKAKDAPEGFSTKETWFYRLDMPEGYKNFSKTKPMKLEHCQPIRDWWKNRQEIIIDDNNIKAKCFTVEQLVAMNCNFDQCKFPKVIGEIPTPEEIIEDYYCQRNELNSKIEQTLDSIKQLLGIDLTEK